MFKFLEYLTIHKVLWKDLTEEEKKEFSPFVLNLFFRNNVDYIELINEVQNYNFTKEQYYNFMLRTLPKGRIMLEYVKSSNVKIEKDFLIFLSDKFNFNINDSERFIKMNTQEDLILMLKKFQVNEKTIKKWILKNK